MSIEIPNYERLRDCTENILAIYGVLDARWTYVFPTFTMVKKDGEVKTMRHTSECGSTSELRVPTHSAMHVFKGSNCLNILSNESHRLCNASADLKSVWRDCSKPKNGAEKLHLDQWVEDYDIKVKWINSVTICAVCLRTIRVNKGSEFAAKTLSDIQWGRRDADPLKLSDQLISHAKDRYWYYGIHPECNPRKTATKSNLISVLKPSADNQWAINRGLLKPHESVDLIKTLADCWPGYAKIYKQIISKGTAVKIKERAVRQWAKRNPNKASTEAARSFFKLVFGISNLTKYTNDINTKQNRQNLRTAKPRNPMLARSR